MADDKTVVESEFDEEGKPIVKEEENNEGDQTPEKKETVKEPLEDDEIDIPVRGSASHIIARQKRTIEKLRSRQEEDDEVRPDDEELTPEAKSALSREVKRHTAPVLDALAAITDEAELRQLFAEDPESKKYEKTIRAYMKHEAWRAVPPDAIYHHLAYSTAATVKSEKKQIADRQAAGARGAGSSRRQASGTNSGLPTAEEIADMSEADFEALQHQARTGQFLS